MSKAVLLVTGSSGLIGRALVQQASHAYEVVALDRAIDPGFVPGGAHAMRCDLDSDASVAGAFAEIARLGVVRMAAVVHLASEFGSPDMVNEPNSSLAITATRRLLHALQGFAVEQFMFASTMTVHAPGRPGRRINEDSRLDPRWNFPRSKLNVEELLREEAAGMPVVNLRMAGVYDDLCHSIPLAQQIERIREKRITSRHFAGNVKHGQSYLHLDDLIDAILRTVKRRHALSGNTSLLLGEPETASYDSLQRKIGWMLHAREWKTRLVSKRIARTALWLQYRITEVDPFLRPWMLEVADHHYELDITRAEQLLGWRPQRSLVKTLPDMIEGLRADRARWERDHRISA